MMLFLIYCILSPGAVMTQSAFFHRDHASSPPMTSMNLTYGDMALSKIQKFAFSHNSKSFNGIPDPTRRWKDAIIPYVIDCSLEHIKEAVDSVKAAIVEWEQKTCIRFVKHTTEKFHLTFFRQAYCWGNVGQVKGAKISVGPGCEFNFVMAHEIGHAVGLYHEHNRPDRDNWVNVLWENIGGFRDAFSIQHNSESYGVGYDYTSIMHYPWNAFSINGRDTMRPRRLRRGQVPYIAISKQDVKLVSRMYNCPAIVRKRRYRSKRSRLLKREAHEKRILKDSINEDYDSTQMEQEDTMVKRDECVDVYRDCPNWKRWCTAKSDQVRHFCPKTCGICHGPPTLPPTKPPPTKAPTLAPSATKVFPWRKDTWPNRRYMGIGRLCRDITKMCAKYTQEGQCRTNPGWMLLNCMVSCMKLGYHVECDARIATPGGACSNPLGLGVREDDSRVLPNSAFTAYDRSVVGGWEAPAYNARLYADDDRPNKKIGAWCARNPKPVDRWLQVDLGEVKRITYISTQGRPRGYERTEVFKIAHSNTPNPRDFKFYQENGQDKKFFGNCDYRTPVLNRFRNPIRARYIRYYPWKWNWACVRMELYGC